MRRIAWLGWPLAGLLLLQNVTAGLAAPATDNPLEGRVLWHSGGNVYLYHQGFKFLVERAEVGDQVIDAIPAGSPEQWAALLSGSAPVQLQGAPQPSPAGEHQPAAPGQPEPFPGYS
jgi:hypothetical protein